ncbi:unnamed protein product [Lactuca virosa]|uniref:Uncharacterized protein n=1 Tax=Lactuca virosa TaxID=75947 RepID=A0AAU9N640_9ASTR|nr:unnamed protein product [Lactuca virosa]
MSIGLEEDFQGLVDLVQLKAYFFHVLAEFEKLEAEITVEDFPEAHVAESSSIKHKDELYLMYQHNT